MFFQIVTVDTSLFEPYLGKPTIDRLAFHALPFTTRILLHFVNQVLDKAQGSGYHVYTDRFYTSCILAAQLQERQVHLTGTIQKNRVGLPAKIKRLRLRNNDVKIYSRWYDEPGSAGQTTDTHAKHLA